VGVEIVNLGNLGDLPRLFLGIRLHEINGVTEGVYDFISQVIVNLSHKKKKEKKGIKFFRQSKKIINI